MAKLGGKLLIKYRDPVAASFSSKDIVLNVQTGTLFYKRNRRLFALRGTPDNFDLVVFPGQSTDQQILINDSSQEDGSRIMEGTDQFRFKLASATCGCANYFYIGAETLTHFSGSVRIGEHLPSTCNLLDSEVDPALLVHGNIYTTASNGGYPGHISASGNVHASLDLYGNNAYIHGSLIHRDNTGTKLTFGTDIIQLTTDSNVIATLNSSSLTVNSPYDLFIPGTNSVTGPLSSSGTTMLVMDNSTGQVYKTGSYQGETFKSSGIRSGIKSEITGALGVLGNLSINGYITASKAQFTNLDVYPNIASNFSVLTELNGNVFTTSSAAFNHYNFASVADNSNTVTSNAQIINFVGNAVTASGAGNLATVTVNAITESLWYDGRHFPSSFLSSSYNILVGNGGSISSSGGLKHNIHITSSNQSSSIGFINASSSHWSTGFIQSSQHNIFHISDHGTSNTDTGTQVLKIYGTGSGDLLSAPEAISIHSGLRTGGATPNPTFIGATDVNIPTIMIDPVGHSTSLAKLHINTMGADDGLLYNGLCVGPYYNPNVHTDQNSGSGVFIHIGETHISDTDDSFVPRITGKTEQGNTWGNNFARGFLITAETDRSEGYPGGQPQFGNAVGRSTVMEFKVKDVGKSAYSASINNPSTSGISSFTLGGFPNTSSMASIYGTGEEFIIGMETTPRISTNRDANYLYSFKNDSMPLLAIEASGKIGIGNFTSHTIGKTNAPQAILDISAKSGSDADIFLKTFTKNTIPLIKLEVDSMSGSADNQSGTSTRLYNPNLHRGEFYLHTDHASGSFYEKQKTNSVVIESKGKEEGLAGQTYPFNIRGAAQNNFEANNIQLVVGGDNSPNRNSSITSSHIHDGVYPSFSTNNGRAAITIEGISDFRRFGEVGIGLESPSSSLHVTRSVQADNFRTTNPVDILIQSSLHSITMNHGSNSVTGSNTKFLDDFKVGDAIKITGRSIISTPPYEYHITSSHTSASVKVAVSASSAHKQLVSTDLILISSGALHTGIIQTGSFHNVTTTTAGGGGNINNSTVDSHVLFEPAYTGIQTASINLIHRVNPHHYQIATVTGIDSQHSMSISQNWEGITWTGSLGYKEDTLFEVKTADYRSVFSIAADGTTTIGGSVGTFKSTGLREGNSIISGNLTIRPLDNLPPAELNILSRDTGSAAHSILRLKQFDYGVNTTGSKLMYNADDNEFQILGNKGSDKHLTIHHDSGLVTVNENLTVENNITSSNNISASGLLYASSSVGNYSNVVVQDTASGRFYTTASAALTTTLSDGLLSSSAQIATDISGAFNGATGSFLLNTTDTLTGDLTVTGTITAQEFHTEFVSSSIIFESGSTQFGNSADDIHTFSGSINVKDEGHITASGNISASGNLYANKYHSHGYNVLRYKANEDRVLVGSKFKTTHITGSSLTLGDTPGFHVTASGNISSSATLIANEANIIGNITASGNISASGAVTASGLLLNDLGSIEWPTANSGRQTIKGTDNYIQIDGDNRILMAADNDITINSPETNISGDVSASGKLYGTDIYAVGNITSSANISASGLLFASSSQGNFSDIVVQDLTNGRFYTTSSAGLSVGLDTFKTTGQRNGNSGITGSLIVQGPSHTVSINTAYGNVSSPAGMGQFSTLQIGNNAAIGTATFGGGYGVTGLSIASNGKLQTNSSLTADGKISGSGLLYASASSANGNPYQTVMINTASGEFFYTGSYGGGGGGSTFTAAGISGSWESQNFANLSATGISGSFLLNTTDTFTGALNVAGHITASSNQAFPLRIDTAGVNRQDGVGIEFSAKDDHGQRGHILFTHYDSQSSGSGASFRLGSTEASTSILIDKLVAGGDISGSGNLFADVADSSDTSFKTVMYDTATGKFFRTGSYAVGGGGGSADNLGNHTATQDLDMAGNSIDDADEITASGDISGSGKLFAGLTTNTSTPASNNLPVTYNPGTGEFKQVTNVTNFFAHSSVANKAFKTISVSGTNAVADTSADTLNLGGSTYITVTGTANDTITIAYTGGTGTMSQFTLEGDTGTDQTIANGNTLSILGGTGITTATAATDDLTVNLSYSANNTNFIGAAAVANGSTNTPITTDNIIFEDLTSTDTVRQINFGNVPLSIFNNNLDGSGISVDGSNKLSFDPGGGSGNLISSDGATSYNVHSDLVFDGTNLQVHGGDIIAFYSSDKRLKDNVIPITNPISKIMKIGGYTFDWNEKQDTYNGHDVGVIAQEVEKVLPEVVETRENGYKAVKYDKMVPLLIEAIKDQQKQIDELKKLIENGKQ